MNKWIEILIGLVLVIGSVYLVFGDPLGWELGQATWTVLKGGIMWGIFFVGLLFILLGISDLKG